MQIPAFRLLSKWLLEKGYVVALPLRRGYGTAAGVWSETYGKCNDPDFVKAGHETARDITAVMGEMLKHPFVLPNDIVVIGQSAGGWGALALASQNPANVRAFINLSGGRGGWKDGRPHSNCTPQRLVQAAATFGKTARRPTLWIYSENDTYFDPRLVNQMHRAFVGAGGRASLHVLLPIGDDGHTFVSQRQSSSLWQPLVEGFLEKASTVGRD